MAIPGGGVNPQFNQHGPILDPNEDAAAKKHMLKQQAHADDADEGIATRRVTIVDRIKKLVHHDDEHS